jgi:hypothetical protein
MLLVVLAAGKARPRGVHGLVHAESAGVSERDPITEVGASDESEHAVVDELLARIEHRTFTRFAAVEQRPIDRRQLPGHAPDPPVIDGFESGRNENRVAAEARPAASHSTGAGVVQVVVLGEAAGRHGQARGSHNPLAVLECGDHGGAEGGQQPDTRVVETLKGVLDLGVGPGAGVELTPLLRGEGRSDMILR